MELRQLRYFAAVAQERHVGRASKKLHIAQPALSRQIQKLEEEFGKKLLTRHSKGVSLTGDGAHVLEVAGRIIRDVDDLSKQMGVSRRSLHGEVTIASTPGMAELISVPVTTKASKLYPNVRLRIRGAFMPAMEDVIARGDADLAIFNGMPRRSDLAMRSLFKEQLCVVCRYDDKRFRGARLSVDDLEGIPLVISGLPNTGARRIVDAAAKRAGFTLNIVAEADTVAASSKLVLAGLGPTIHVAALVQDQIDAKKIRAIPIDGLYMSRILAYSPRAPLSPEVGAIAKTIIEWAEEMLATDKWAGVEPDISVRSDSGMLTAETPPVDG